ncbi:YciI family protein [Paenibacillus daejeonensis]|uniref:YciI family protein n=1 Tax=Paenibacillus daejeonensis TaxID=135193 RepID=UPI00037FBD0E|nr:YciI family protein [Paenibacillus daejeonensis]
MKFILLTRSSRYAEAGIQASTASLAATEDYLEELAAAGVLVATEVLSPSSSGWLLSYPVPGCEPVLTPGPLDEPQQLVAGYTVIEVEHEEEAMQWARRMPDPNGYGEGAVEVRRIREGSLPTHQGFQQVMEDELRSRIGLRLHDQLHVRIEEK